jgi:hypothetical protein
MTEYALYLESGPKMRTTMAHVFGLLGCTASGPTTGEALEAAPEEIRRFLEFLRQHGETVDLRSKITTSVAAHVMEGSWIGYGDPAPGFAPDFGPLTPKERDLHLRRLDWMRADFAELLSRVSTKQLTTKPASGRALRPIVEHVAGADAAYLRATVGPFAELREATKAVERADVPLVDALRSLWAVSHVRLAAMDEDERTRMVRHGEKIWTARRGMRRMLEHQWEHLREVERRFDAKR